MTTWKTNKDEQLSTQIHLHQLRRRGHHPYFFVVSSWYLHFSIIHLLDMDIDPCMRDSARTICIDSNKQICPYKYTPDPAKNRTTSDLWKTLELTDSSSPFQIKEESSEAVLVYAHTSKCCSVKTFSIYAAGRLLRKGEALPNIHSSMLLNKGNNKITELRTILQRESKSS